jgi:hypothetical protein
VGQPFLIVSCQLTKSETDRNVCPAVSFMYYPHPGSGACSHRDAVEGECYAIPASVVEK